MCQYAKEYYGVPADVGRRVSIDGRSGIITEDRGHYIGVNFDDCKPGIIFNAHPTWKVEYLEMGIIRHSRLVPLEDEIGEIKCSDHF